MLEPRLMNYVESCLTKCSFPLLGEGGFDVGEDGRGSLGGNMLLTVSNTN